MGNRLWAMVRKEFIQIRRDKRTLAMMLAIPVLWLVMFGYAASFDIKSLKLALINESPSPVASNLAKAFADAGTFTLVEVADATPTGLRELLRQGKAQLAIQIPAQFGRPNAGADGQLQVMVDGSDYFSAMSASRLVQSVLQEAQGGLKMGVPGMPPAAGTTPAAGATSGAPQPPAATLAATPSLLPHFDVLYNPGLKSANVMIPGLLGMVLLFITALMTALGVVREREAGTLEQLVVTPIRPLELMLGKILPYALVGLVDFALVLVCGIYLFDVSFQGNLPLFVGLSLLFLLCTLSLGLVVSTLAQNQMQAVQMAMFMLFPQFLLSGFVFPLDAMPTVIRWLANLFPLTYYIPIARGMFLKGAGLDLLVQPTLELVAYTVILVAVASIRFRKRIA